MVGALVTSSDSCLLRAQMKVLFAMLARVVANAEQGWYDSDRMRLWLG